MPNGKPNILIIWGDDIGITNLSRYSDGLMGYRTPNIDRIADEGMRFTDSYGQQSCTPLRLHHRAESLSHRPHQSGHARRTLACRQKMSRLPSCSPLGYHGQFGKNHFGDMNSTCPPCMVLTSSSAICTTSTLTRSRSMSITVEEEYPNFRKLFGPRGVLHAWATEGRPH